MHENASDIVEFAIDAEREATYVVPRSSVAGRNLRAKADPGFSLRLVKSIPVTLDGLPDFHQLADFEFVKQLQKTNAVFFHVRITFFPMQNFEQDACISGQCEGIVISSHIQDTSYSFQSRRKENAELQRRMRLFCCRTFGFRRCPSEANVQAIRHQSPLQIDNRYV